jgi:hypothetical protein
VWATNSAFERSVGVAERRPFFADSLLSRFTSYRAAGRSEAPLAPSPASVGLSIFGSALRSGRWGHRFVKWLAGEIQAPYVSNSTEQAFSPPAPRLLRVTAPPLPRGGAFSCLQILHRTAAVEMGFYPRRLAPPARPFLTVEPVLRLGFRARRFFQRGACWRRPVSPPVLLWKGF